VIAPKRIYFFGIPASGGELPYFVRVYDPENDSWMFGADPPAIRNMVGVGVVNDILYIIGGLTYDRLGYEMPYATNEQYMPIGYGTIPPSISIASVENSTVNTVSLSFTVNKPYVWLAYSLDGKENVTLTGNTTITGLTSGLHNVTVYAKDTFENTGASETITFSVEVPFPVVPVAAASAATVAVVGVGLLVYFKKRKH
jgi:hypothetical protein